MSRLKGVLLYSFGVLLLIFGNRSALSALFEDKEVSSQSKEESPKSGSSMFGTIELNKSGADSVSSSKVETAIESDDVETATGSE